MVITNDRCIKLAYISPHHEDLIIVPWRIALSWGKLIPLSSSSSFKSPLLYSNWKNRIKD
jgi:hypothetical protein